MQTIKNIHSCCQEGFNGSRVQKPGRQSCYLELSTLSVSLFFVYFWLVYKFVSHLSKGIVQIKSDLGHSDTMSNVMGICELLLAGI